MWKLNREKIMPMVVWMKRAVAEEKEKTGWTKSLQMMIDKMSEKDDGMKSLIETFEKKLSQEEKGPRQPNMAKMIKPAKVPTWTKDMSLETFRRQIEIWQVSSTDVHENTQFQDLVESLKHNEYIKGLAKYVG